MENYVLEKLRLIYDNIIKVGKYYIARESGSGYKEHDYFKVRVAEMNGDSVRSKILVLDENGEKCGLDGDNLRVYRRLSDSDVIGMNPGYVYRYNLSWVDLSEYGTDRYAYVVKTEKDGKVQLVNLATGKVVFEVGLECRAEILKTSFQLCVLRVEDKIVLLNMDTGKIGEVQVNDADVNIKAAFAFKKNVTGHAYLSVGLEIHNRKANVEAAMDFDMWADDIPFKNETVEVSSGNYHGDQEYPGNIELAYSILIDKDVSKVMYYGYSEIVGMQVMMKIGKFSMSDRYRAGFALSNRFLDLNFCWAPMPIYDIYRDIGEELVKDATDIIPLCIGEEEGFLTLVAQVEELEGGKERYIYRLVDRCRKLEEPLILERRYEEYMVIGNTVFLRMGDGRYAIVSLMRKDFKAKIVPVVECIGKKDGIIRFKFIDNDNKECILSYKPGYAGDVLLTGPDECVRAISGLLNRYAIIEYRRNFRRSSFMRLKQEQEQG